MCLMEYQFCDPLISLLAYLSDNSESHGLSFSHVQCGHMHPTVFKQHLRIVTTSSPLMFLSITFQETLIISSCGVMHYAQKIKLQLLSSVELVTFPCRDTITLNLSLFSP